MKKKSKKKPSLLSEEKAAFRIQGMYRGWVARGVMEGLRRRREETLKKLMSSPQVKKIGGRFGMKWMFRAPGEKAKVALGKKECMRAADVPTLDGKAVHPDVGWLTTGLSMFYNKYNKEALPNVKKIAVASAGHAAELREKMIKKYPTVPVYEFDWLRSTPTAATGDHTPRSKPRSRAATLLSTIRSPALAPKSPVSAHTPTSPNLNRSFFSTDSNEVPALSSTQPLLLQL